MQSVDIGVTKHAIELVTEYTIELSVNGRLLRLELDPRTSLLHALREHLHPIGANPQPVKKVNPTSPSGHQGVLADAITGLSKDHHEQ